MKIWNTLTATATSLMIGAGAYAGSMVFTNDHPQNTHNPPDQAERPEQYKHVERVQTSETDNGETTTTSKTKVDQSAPDPNVGSQKEFDNSDFNQFAGCMDIGKFEITKDYSSSGNVTGHELVTAGINRCVQTIDHASWKINIRDKDGNLVQTETVAKSNIPPHDGRIIRFDLRDWKPSNSISVSLQSLNKTDDPGKAPAPEPLVLPTPKPTPQPRQTIRPEPPKPEPKSTMEPKPPNMPEMPEMPEMAGGDS